MVDTNSVALVNDLKLELKREKELRHKMEYEFSKVKTQYEWLT